MIDPTLITRKITLIAQDLEDLRGLARRPPEDSPASRVDEALAERYLERAIGRMIDINYHLITESGHPPPKDYYEPLLQMGRLTFLPSDFAQRVAACAGPRNRIVHE